MSLEFFHLPTVSFISIFNPAVLGCQEKRSVVKMGVKFLFAAVNVPQFPHDCWKNKLLCLALVQEKLIHGRCGTTNIFSPLLDLVFIQTRVGDGGGMQRWGEDIKNIVQQMLTCKQMNFKREEEEFRFVSALQLEWSLTTSVQMLQNTCWLPPQLVQEPHK